LGCYYINSTIKHCQTTEKLAENEIIVGFRGFLDKETGRLRSISMKTALLPKKLSSPPLLRLSSQ
jgi:hypothetical protein